MIYLWADTEGENDDKKVFKVTCSLPLRGSSNVKKDTEKNVVAFVRAVVDR